MSTGYRSIIIALVGIALAGANEAPQKPAQPEQRQASAQMQNALPNTSAPSAVPLKPVEPPEYYQPCGKTGSKGNSDLCAQWSAAEAARDAANWAWLQLWLSGLGVIGLLVSLHYTRKATNAAVAATHDAERALEIAERNANAAHEQVRLSERTAEYQLRAYMGIAAAWVENFGYHNQQIVIQYKNFGATSAYDLKVWLAIASHPIEHFGDNPTVRSTMEMPPGHDRKIYSASQTHERFFNAVAQGEVEYVVTVWFEYTTLGTLQKSRYVMKWPFDTSRGGELVEF